MTQLALKAVSEFVSDWKDGIVAREKEKPQPLLREDMMGLCHLLESPCVYSCNLADIAGISQLVASVAKIDRLPSNNTLEAQKILRSAWDNVDICSKVAHRCKVVTKVLYVLLLLIGVAITAVAVFSFNEMITKDQLRSCVLGLSLSGSFVAAMVSYINPGQRWQQLRGAALSLESEVWMFRTRTGSYTISSKVGVGQHSKKPERRLLEVLESLTQHISKSASVMETTFFAKYDIFGKSKSPGVYKHGQYKGSRAAGTFGTSLADDDHHRPLVPQEYITFRVMPVVEFYQSKLPQYYHSRTATEILLLAGAFSGTVLAFLHLEQWAAIVTAIAGAITSWKEFHGTEKKLTRYGNTIEKIKSTILWWGHLTEVEQANLANANRLVSACEDVLEREREAWLSTSMTTKALAAAGAAELNASDTESPV
jgi:hypothetical protein